MPGKFDLPSKKEVDDGEIEDYSHNPDRSKNGALKNMCCDY